MIVTFWLYAASLFDTPERRIKMEARRMADALKKYNKAYEAEMIKKSSRGH